MTGLDELIHRLQQNIRGQQSPAPRSNWQGCDLRDLRGYGNSLLR